VNRRLLFIAPLGAAAALIPIGLASASGYGQSGDPAPAVRTGKAPAPRLPSPGEQSAVGWGSSYQPPLPGSGIDTSKLVPGLTVTYGAATGGLFPSAPSADSGYVPVSTTNHPPARGEIDGFLGNDGHTYYRVVNRGPNGVTYSH
jgi:hypothetical protein